MFVCIFLRLIIELPNLIFFMKNKDNKLDKLILLLIVFKVIFLSNTIKLRYDVLVLNL